MHFKCGYLNRHRTIWKVTIVWCPESRRILSRSVCCETGWIRRQVLLNCGRGFDCREARNSKFPHTESFWISSWRLFRLNCSHQKYRQASQYQDCNKMHVDVNQSGLIQETVGPNWGHLDEKHGKIQKIHGSMKNRKNDTSYFNYFNFKS